MGGVAGRAGCAPLDGAERGSPGGPLAVQVCADANCAAETERGAPPAAEPAGREGFPDMAAGLPSGALAAAAWIGTSTRAWQAGQAVYCPTSVAVTGEEVLHRGQSSLTQTMTTIRYKFNPEYK